MTKMRTGEAFLPADEYGRSLPKLSANLLVRSIEKSRQFVLGANIRYWDNDFAALSILGIDFMLHADHAFDHHPLYAYLTSNIERGIGAELRILGLDPDQVEAQAKSAGARVVQPTKDSRMVGGKSPFSIRTATSGRSDCLYRPWNNQGCDARPWFHLLIVSSSAFS